MNCLTCETELSIVYYKCTESDYRLEHSNGDLIYIKDTHNLDKDYEEVNTQCKYRYCSECKKLIDYPTTYENNKFKNGDLIVEEYNNYLNHNIIHNFTNITCRYCNNHLLEKGYYNHTLLENETPELFSYPEGFKNRINIINAETNNNIKTIDIDITDLNIPETEIGKKIIYCPSCNFFITNNLKEIYKD